MFSLSHYDRHWIISIPLLYIMLASFSRPPVVKKFDSTYICPKNYIDNDLLIKRINDEPLNYKFIRIMDKTDIAL